MPAAGRLDRRGVLKRKTVVQDETGQPIETYTPWFTGWFGKKDVRAEERWRANQELAMETTVWVSHWISGVRTDDRLEIEEKDYDVIGIAEIGRRSGIEIIGQAVRV